MLIRTQDKKALIDMTGMTIKAILNDTIKEKYKIIAYSNHNDLDSCEILGMYTSEKKVMKVLDIIQNEYLNGNLCYVHSGFVKNIVFNMPEDIEVEI